MQILPLIFAWATCHSTKEEVFSMNYYAAKDMADSFRTVRKNTLIIAQELPQERYAFRAAPEARSVGELLAHIASACTLQYQLHAVERRSSFEGFDLPSLIKRVMAEEKEPRTKDQVLEMLRTSGEKWVGFVEGLTDDFLAERVQMLPGTTPPSKSRFEMILSVKEHEMHHRGQLMLIERLIGIVPHMTREMQSRLSAAAATS
jgi:uncharacterized damage-inducible protein DinB